ncbi:hypothetical protein DMENIID0001_044110 [Sergentomyia squamirostris]
MKSEVVFLVILFVALQPLPSARGQDDGNVPQFGQKQMAQLANEAARQGRMAQSAGENYAGKTMKQSRVRRNADPQSEDPSQPPEETLEHARLRRDVPQQPPPHSPPHPDSHPHQGYPQPQKFVDRVRRSAKGTGALPQRKG